MQRRDSRGWTRLQRIIASLSCEACSWKNKQKKASSQHKLDTDIRAHQCSQVLFSTFMSLRKLANLKMWSHLKWQQTPEDSGLKREQRAGREKHITARFLTNGNGYVPPTLFCLMTKPDFSQSLPASSWSSPGSRFTVWPACRQPRGLGTSIKG